MKELEKCENDADSIGKAFIKWVSGRTFLGVSMTMQSVPFVFGNSVNLLNCAGIDRHLEPILKVIGEG